MIFISFTCNFQCKLLEKRLLCNIIQDFPEINIKKTIFNFLKTSLKSKCINLLYNWMSTLIQLTINNKEFYHRSLMSLV